MKIRSAFALAFLVAGTMAARADSSSADGFWELQYDDGKPEAWFLVSHKGDTYSARLVKGYKKEGEDEKPPDPICRKCPGEKKGARVMGLTLFWGLKQDGLKYTGGSVVDPRDGSVYHAKMDLSDDGQELAVRGYLGIEMLGKTQTWHRLPDSAMKPKEIPKEVLAKAGASPAASPSPTPTEGQAQ